MEFTNDDSGSGCGEALPPEADRRDGISNGDYGGKSCEALKKRSVEKPTQFISIDLKGILTMNDQTPPAPGSTPAPGSAPGSAPGTPGSAGNPQNYSGGFATPPHTGYQQPAPPAPRRTSYALMWAVRFIISIVLISAVLFFGLACGLFFGFTAGVFSFGADRVVSAPYRAGSGSQKIAIIPIEGIIDGHQVQFVRKAVDAVLKQKNIKAVVLRVDSPGGGINASDQIYYELGKIKQKGLPVVSSYGGVAASGGYYVSAFSDHIYAEPTTITGSIGVIAQALTFDQLLNEKLGIKPEVITATDAIDKDTASPFRNWTEKDRKFLRDLLDIFHARFVKIVDEGRGDKLTISQTRALATGRAFHVDEALEKNLVDDIGYLDAALEKARQLAGIKRKNPPVIIYCQPEGFGSSFGAIGRPASVTVKLDSKAIQREIMQSNTPSFMYLYQP